MTAYTSSLKQTFSSLLGYTVKRVEAWANCWFVVCEKIGARFVSYKQVTKPKKAKSSRKIESEIKSAIGIKSRKKLEKLGGTWMLQQIMKGCGAGSYEYNVAYGILWSMESCRIDGILDMAIDRYMDGNQIINLVAVISTWKLDIGDVPYWLNKNYDIVAQYNPIWKR